MTEVESLLNLYKASLKVSGLFLNADVLVTLSCGTLLSLLYFHDKGLSLGGGRGRLFILTPETTLIHLFHPP